MTQGFYLRFEIEGVPELSRILGLTYQKLGNLKKPLRASANLILEDVEQQFKTEGGLTGGWQPLSEATIRGRKGSAHPILQVSGALRRSFYSLVDEKRAIISSKSPYFKYHQSRMPRKKLPRRAMLVLTDRTKENIVQEFNQFLRFK